MGISFFEVMDGEVVDLSGQTHPIRFEIKGESTDLPNFITTGKVKITGIVDAPPFAREAALEGEMVIRPILDRKITYQFRFRDPDGRLCNFSGGKDVSLTKPVHSMTHMTAAIERDNITIAMGELRFDITELYDFLASWWPSTGIPQEEMHKPLGGKITPLSLTENERQTLHALAEAAIVPSKNVPAVDERTINETIFQLQSMPGHVFSLYKMALRWLDRLPLATDFRHFKELPLVRRRELIEEWHHPQTSAGKLSKIIGAPLLVQVLVVVVKAAHFGHPNYLDAIEHPRSKEIPAEKPERYMRRVISAEDLEEEAEIRAHVLVIGTGAGGAAIAYQLAKKGLAVAILEEGRYHQRHNFSGPPLERVHAMYRHKATNFSVGTAIVIPQGRAVGGTTTINSGTCFATPDHVLDQWRRDMGFPDDFSPQNYQPYSDAVAAMLQVAPADQKALGKIADVIARGADKMGLGHGPLPRNAPGCPGAGECILGCPEGAKRSTDISYIPAALQEGAELYTGLRATRILMNGSRAVAVEARGSDRFGRPRILRIHADRIVLACGSLQTPLFLRENGFRLPHIGRNLSVHPALGLIARMPENLQPWHSIPQGYALHALEEDGIRFEGYYLHPQLLAPQLPWIGERFSAWMDDFPNLAQFGFMVRDESRGSVRRGPNGQPLISYLLSERSIQRLKKGASLLAHLFLEADAREVYVGFGENPIVRSPAQARALLDVDAGPLDFRLLGAHPLGTCRMAASAEHGVVDFEHRVFGTDNLHIVDGSTVPSSLGVNPQMTIMAMALRAGDKIGEMFEHSI